MTEHIQLTKTRSQIKNCKIAQTQWEDFFNKTFLMKGLALLFKVYSDFHHVHSLGIHPCLLIPEMNKNVGLFTTSNLNFP